MRAGLSTGQEGVLPAEQAVTMHKLDKEVMEITQEQQEQPLSMQMAEEEEAD